MGNIYDGAFRTILNDCRKMILPVINEIFDEEYIGDEKIEFFPNEHFLDQQDAADKERITDTNFRVIGKEIKKYHLECESSLPDGKMTIRLFKYDAQIALDEGEVMEETLTVAFPNTAVLYLRAYKKTPDKMRYVIVTPGGTVQYDIPVMKEIAQKYENVQKGVGDIMGGALIETSARKLKIEADNEANKKTAQRMLNMGKLTIEEVAICSGLSVEEVEQLAGLQTV